ncbi:MAG TPA: TIGR03013 family XrtA/PEP-CTERM system glycosyltransferase [Vicinamibacterales bacterium]|jgi:sugar transferase (PEP-CTERM system associated)
MLAVLTRQIHRRTVLLIAYEHLLIVAAVFAGAWVRLGTDFILVSRVDILQKAMLIAAATQLCLYYADLYDLRSITDRRDLFMRIVQALGGTSLLLALVYFWVPKLIIGRGVFMVAALLVISVVTGWRLGFEWLSRRMSPRERWLLVGTSAAAVTLTRELFERRQELGIEIIGFVDPDPMKVGQPVLNPGVIGTIEDIPSIVRARGVDRVIVSLADARGKLPMDKLLEMKLDGDVSFAHLPTVYEDYTGKIAVENLRPSWLIFSEGFRKTRLLRAGKRALDIAAAGVGLVVAAPFLLLVGLLVRLTSPGPALYHQQRVGQHGRIFIVHKFRSMRTDAEAKTGAVWATANDSRVTGFGRFMRRSRIDELPQLWNVLKGDMSFVGPRPERPEFVASLVEQIPFYGLRHAVRPGLTGWAQVRYTYGASVEDALEKLQYDLFYIKHVTIALDLFIMFMTLKTVLLRKGAQ